MKQFFFGCVSILFFNFSNGQIINCKVVDELTKEPLQGAIIECNEETISSAFNGSFSLPSNATQIKISHAGYFEQKISIQNKKLLIVILKRNTNYLNEVVVSANRSVQKRSEAPIAISIISKQTIEETKATRLDQLLNKVSGVSMVNLGNEQHAMSIRQPMTTKSLFLYLEDGIPVRTTGLFNHNALLEMNMATAKQIEVIKGPASSIYGAEAIGGAVNIITQAPPAFFNGTASVQVNNTGYKRADLQIGSTSGKLGLLLSGYYANRRNGPIAHSDFYKAALSLRADYSINEKMKWVNDITYVNYYSNMLGSLDSIRFLKKDYSNLHTFTYRKVPVFRMKSQLFYDWGNNSASQVGLVFRDNSVQQNPSYRVKNALNDSKLAHGEINENAFNSYMLMIQHKQKFIFLSSKIIAGITADASPSAYNSNYIRIQRDEKGYYIAYNKTDSVLSKYSTKIQNLAGYFHYEASPLKGLKIIAALRYDYYQYNFRNALSSSSFSGAPSSKSNFKRVSPKIGLTYNYKSVGVYGNYSEGFVPPQISELFTGVKVPYLGSQTFFNYEIGGWFSLIKDKLYADWSYYLLMGSNEIISVKNPDNSTENKNAGKTKHAGIEYGINYKPNSQLFLRFSAANSKHEFLEYVEKGVSYNDKELPGGPHFIANAEVTYKPAFIKGLRFGVEWQHVGSYFMDNANSKKYAGYDLFNVRAGYKYKNIELWINAINATDVYYSTLASKSGSTLSYNLGDPQEFSIGLGYSFSRKRSTE